MPTSWLIAPRSCSSHQHLFRGFGIQSGSSNSYERSQPAASSWSRIPFSGSPQDGPQPQNGGPNQAGAPGIPTKGAKNSLPTASTGSHPLNPYHWGRERGYSRNNEEKVTRVGVPNCLCRLWTKALHQESRSPSPADWGDSWTRPSGSDPRKEPVSSPKGIWKEMEPIDSSSRRRSIHPPVEPPLLPWSSWVTFTLGTLRILGERGGKRMLIKHTCITFLSPLMSPPRKLRPSLLLWPDTWSGVDASGTL